MARVFAGCEGVPMGSLKSNLGHLITTAGVAGLLKVLAAIKHEIRPKTLHTDAPIDALAGTPLRLLAENEEWRGPKRAAISAFGFGGNNAHLIVESLIETTGYVASAARASSTEATHATQATPAGAERPPCCPIAIVGIGARVGNGDSARDFAASLFAGTGTLAPRDTLAVDLEGLKFPPTDLQQTLAQQTMVLEAAREAAHNVRLPRDTTSVLIGMGCDAEVARYGARWRLATRADAASSEVVAPDWLQTARDSIVPVLQSAGVLGTMPNIPANRITSQLDLAGPAFTVSSEEGSGISALWIAARALRAGEIDAALVGAVDMSHEPVHITALAELGLTASPGDAAVVLTLKRLSDAERDGDPVYATMGTGCDFPVGYGDSAKSASDSIQSQRAVSVLRFGDGAGALNLEETFGKAHAAHGLLHVAAAALALRHRARPAAGHPANPCLGAVAAHVDVSVMDAPRAHVVLSGVEPAPWSATDPGRLHIYSGKNQAAVLQALADGRESPGGPARLVLVAAGESERTDRAELARRWLLGGGPVPEGVAFREAPIGGQVAFVFTGAAAAYPGMGRDLALALPAQVRAVSARCSEVKSATDWIYGPGDGLPTHPLDQLWGTSFLCQLHAEVTRQVLRISPHATIGYSSGESNALFAMGAWNDLGEMMRESRGGTAFTSDLCGEFNAPRRAWERLGRSGSTWVNYIVAAPVAIVREALADEPLAHITIINTSDDCVIGGESEACARALERIGTHRALPLGYAMAAHCPEVEEISAAWWKLHHRDTRDVPGVRFYTNATNTWFRPTSKLAADAITGQALRTLDFTKTVEAAWNDGVRVFIEHGPRGLCSGWIRQILEGKEHLVVPPDVTGRSGVRQLMNAAAWLAAGGVDADVNALTEALSQGHTAPRTIRVPLLLNAHAPAPHVPPLPPFPLPTSQLNTNHTARTTPASLTAAHLPKTAMQHMIPAPPLESVLHPVHSRENPVYTELLPLPAPMVASPLPLPQRNAPMNDTLARFAGHQAHLAAVHQSFLAQQAAVHGHYLALQQAAQSSLLDAFRALDGMVDSDFEVIQTAHTPPVPERPVVHTQPRLAPPAVPPAARPVAVLAPVAVDPPPAPDPVKTHVLPGPKYCRAELEVLAGGLISSVFGPEFAAQDGYARQVRMPEPPLLLADRVTGIDAVPGSMGKGTLWTETDVRADSWYLDNEGRMPAGIMIESGQADLLLISWLGVDSLNKGERVYRLLGCDLTYHGGLPVPGDTLAYDIHVDGHATQGDVRLFFFHYDCHVRGEKRLTVRNGQAGFFTDEELLNSAGVLWNPADEAPTSGPLDAPFVACEKTRFSATELRAFASGRPFECFGKGWELTQPHVRSPRITSEKMQFLDEVTEFDSNGGPWKRGYLRAETPVTSSDWFFKGHFKNDPCMPGTLMFDGCLQAMAIYLAALGFTIERDGWRFQPVLGHSIPMRCRGQVTPTSQHLVYEVFVSEVTSGPFPTIYADLLCTVDGRKAFHARRVGLQLVPDWPLEHWKNLLPAATQTTSAPIALAQLAGLVDYAEPKPCAVVDGFSFDYHSLLACAWGPPSAAFGPFYKRFDGTRRAARLPGPPYHFMSRITKLNGPIGGMKAGTEVEVEYDIPSAQWYFEENRGGVMPFCVVMEAALQPCGWLASYVGSALTSETDMLFRNLDGTGTMFADVRPGSGAFTTKVKLLSVSQSAGMIIESFSVECFVGGERCFEMKTVFGFFPKEAFENQVGLPVSTEEKSRIGAPSDFLHDLTERPNKYCNGGLQLAGSMLLMLDRVTGFWPQGGSKQLGYLRGEKTVNVDEWFFKAHFFQDPVQPGSLGVEALCQLLQFFMIETSMGDGVAFPRFEALMLERPVTWKYRGQVVPKNKQITTEIQITELGRDEKGPFAIAEGWLWVDGKRIYHAKNLGMRIVSGTGSSPRSGVSLPGALRSGEDAAIGLAASQMSVIAEELLDCRTAPWILDHCPTWTMPALPMMSMVDRLAGAASASGRTGQVVSSLFDVQVHRWLPFPSGEARLRTEPSGEGEERIVCLSAWRDAPDSALSRFEPVATGRVSFAALGPAPAVFEPLTDLIDEANPYESGALFHGAAFQYLTGLRIGASGSSADLQAEHGSVPRGTIHQGILDAATHGIPHDGLSRWSTEISPDSVGYPYRIQSLHLYEPLPDAGAISVETRFGGFDGSPRFPILDVQIVRNGRVVTAFRLVEILLPRGPLGAAPRAERRAFLREKRYVPGVALSAFDGTHTTLTAANVRATDWLPGNVERIYGVPAVSRGDLLAEVAVREHVARRAFVHPAAVRVEAAGARADMRPLRLHPVQVTRGADDVRVCDAAPAVLDISAVRAYWRKRFAVGEWPVEDLYYGLVERFVGDVVLADPEAFARVRGRSCLYVANHQVAVESLLFSVIVSALSETPTVTLAKAEHRTSWLGTLIAHNFGYPGVIDPKVITFFDRDDKESLIKIVGELADEMKTAGKSVMVHVEGTRALACGQPVLKMGSAFIEMAMAVGAPIIPVRICGGLPRAALAERLEFPSEFGRQDYWLGRPIFPEELAVLPFKERKEAVIAAMNTLGPSLETESPMGGDPAFAAAVDGWQAKSGASHEDAVLFETLAHLPTAGVAARQLVEGARSGRLVVGPEAAAQWLGQLAHRLYGPRGALIQGLR